GLFLAPFCADVDLQALSCPGKLRAVLAEIARDRAGDNLLSNASGCARRDGHECERGGGDSTGNPDITRYASGRWREGGNRRNQRVCRSGGSAADRTVAPR